MTRSIDRPSHTVSDSYVSWGLRPRIGGPTDRPTERSCHTSSHDGLARPLRFDDLASVLGLLQAPVSANIRMIKAVGFVDQVTIPRDRRDYYHLSADPWDARLRSNLVSANMFGALARRGLGAIDEEQDGFARTHLEDVLDFREFIIEEERGRLMRWRERRAKRYAGGIRPWRWQR